MNKGSLLDDIPQAREARRRDAEEAKYADLLRDDLRSVFSTAAGHRVLWYLLGICNFGDLSFREDPYQTAFNEGARGVGIQLLGMLETVDEDIYLKVLRERDGRGRNE